MKKAVIQVVIFAHLVLTFISCNKNEIPPIPVLPPESSLNMDFSNFQQEKSAGLLIENWLYSAASISFFSALSSTHMVVPTAAFNASFAQTPTYIGNQTWQWSYQFPVIGATYTARLNGKTERKDQIRWEMYIDKAGFNGFTNFLWFEGTSVDSTKANWIIYEEPTAPSAVLDIEWKANADRTKSSLVYTYVSSNDEDADSFIEFGKEPEASYDRYYNIYMSKSNININIEWNSEDRDGHVKSPNHYKDDAWHCWNQYLLDDFCAE